MAELLAGCTCRHGAGGTNGRVQWDPERDLMSGDGKVSRKMLSTRAIQIGLKGPLSQKYVDSVLSIEDVTDLAHRVGKAHRANTKDAMDALLPDLPEETDYLPHCSEEVLQNLAMAPGESAQEVAGLGLGKAFKA